MNAGQGIWVVLATLVGSLMGGVGGAEIIKWVTRRKPHTAVRTESEISLAKQAQLYAAQLEEDNKQIRATVRESWDQVEGMQRKLVAINRKMDETAANANRLARYTTWVLTLIFERDQNIERVRAMVNEAPPPAPVDVSGLV
jgi:hypothetical protein